MAAGIDFVTIGYDLPVAKLERWQWLLVLTMLLLGMTYQ